LKPARETEWGLRLVKLALEYLAIGAISFLVVKVLERLALFLEGYLLMTEIHSIHGFSHAFFGIGLASVILFLRPGATAKVVIPKGESPGSSRFQPRFLLGKCSPLRCLCPSVTGYTIISCKSPELPTLQCLTEKRSHAA
jgi:hypothetical protein